MILKGKIAFITGAGQGIGKELCKGLLRKGAKVCVADIDKTKGNNVVDELAWDYGKEILTSEKCDVSNYESFQVAMKSAKAKFGGLDIVCNCAGIGNPETNVRMWDSVVNVNLKGVIYGTMLGLEEMKENGGVVINIGSVQGLAPSPFSAVYSACKFGVVGLSRCIQEVYPESKVRCNCICPTFVNTELTTDSDEMNEVALRLLKEFGMVEPAMVQEAFIKLCEDDSLNGEVLTVTPKGIRPAPKVTLKDLHA